MKLLDTEIAPLGMGCWPIGGPMFSGAEPLGYTNADDGESIRAIHAALSAGIALFDTAAVYGAGHAERLLARALKGRPEALVATKIGIAIDEEKRQLLGEETDPRAVLPAVDRCLARLERDRIDVLFLHLNDLSVPQAEPLFEAMERAWRMGKVRLWLEHRPVGERAGGGRPARLHGGPARHEHLHRRAGDAGHGSGERAARLHPLAARHGPADREI